MKAKYIRWSTLSQSGKRQSLDIDDYDLVFQEQVSGSVAFAKRPKGQEILKMVREGKITELHTEDFTRLGRNAFDILTTLHECEFYNVSVHIKNMNLTSRNDGRPNPLFKMFSHIMSVISEQERENIKERTEMGKIFARQKGIIFGRRRGSNERSVDFLAKPKSKEIFKLLASGRYSIREIAKLCDSSSATVLKVKKVGFLTKKNKK